MQWPEDDELVMDTREPAAPALTSRCAPFFHSLLQRTLRFSISTPSSTSSRHMCFAMHARIFSVASSNCAHTHRGD